MKNLSLFLVLLIPSLILFQTACDEGDDYYKFYEDPFYFDGTQDTTTLKSGLMYMISKTGSGLQPVIGSKVNIDLYYWAYKSGSSAYNPMSLTNKEPMEFVIGRSSQIKGIEEGVMQMKEGGKYRFLIPPYLAYGSDQYGTVPPYASLLYDLELVKVIYPKQVVPFNVAGKDTISTTSGLKILVAQEGTGTKAEVNKTVVTSYTGYLTDGTIFDSTDEFEETYEFKLGEGKVIKGWEEGILYMREGSKYRFIVPASLAYGASGSGIIPPDATIIFDITLIDVK